MTPGDAVVAATFLGGPLADNGGPTPTLLPATGSPLLDAIPGAECGGPNGDILADAVPVRGPSPEGM